MVLHLLETSGGVPPWVVPLVVLFLLLTSLAIVRSIGKGRPHS